MLVNNKNTAGRVKFISYSGDWPNLCRGVLILEIDGKEYKFGHNYSNYHIVDGKGVFTDEDQNNPNFNSFWSSGGYVTGGAPDWNFEVHHAEWEINVDEIPPQFQDLAAEIDTVFNENVEWGCCGGCI